ncbi:SDR family oxidoreductase [Thalassococcus sp. BH17M4-6]|uniref:SDR family oxidoreductase n=1 Tax=Thalassococcus sp. BH17M4-6 TaxID=3413148 RepID=UPI003BE5E31C
MALRGKTAVVTGGGQGIGRAICHALSAARMQVVVSDLLPDLASRVANEVGGIAVPCDVSEPEEIAALVSAAEDRFGAINLFCSNAGFAKGDPGGAVSAPDAQWQASWDVHVMAHVRAARLVLPGMIARGEGVLVNVASGAGLLNQIGDAAYSATKHAAVSLAQSLAITHADQGIQVAVVCPLYVATPLLGYDDSAREAVPHDRVLRPEDVAQSLMEGLAEGRFLILPHAEAGEFARRRATDPEGWIRGMQALRRRVMAELGPESDLVDLHKLI